MQRGPSPDRRPWGLSEPARMTTTLYDLVVALHAAVDPADDGRVTAAVVHLLHAYRARCVGSCTRLAMSMPTPRR